MSTYTPDRWVVISILDTETDKRCLRVLAGWYGGFLTGDSWKISSGITKTVEFKNRYEFLNHSGSTYICFKGDHGMSMIMSSVYLGYEKQMTDTLHVEILDEHATFV